VYDVTLEILEETKRPTLTRGCFRGKNSYWVNLLRVCIRSTLPLGVKAG